MTQSMTAFARVQTSFDETNLSWEIRSVNHRYLDISFRMPEAWRFLEPELRTLIRGKISRGKIECFLKSPEQLTMNPSIVINEGLLDSVLKMADSLAARKQLQNDMTLSSLLNWPGITQAVQPDVEQFAKHVIKLFENALLSLQKARASEGEALKLQVQNRIQRLQEEIGLAKGLIAGLALETRDKLLTRLETLNLELDNSRIEQEIAFLIARMDVSEELDRLTIHTQEVANALSRNDAAGRRLDFLMQELNREANTLSSKSDSIVLTQCAVEMKVLIEQMREQIQNIE